MKNILILFIFLFSNFYILAAEFEDLCSESEINFVDLEKKLIDFLKNNISLVNLSDEMHSEFQQILSVILLNEAHFDIKLLCSLFKYLINNNDYINATKIYNKYGLQPDSIEDFEYRKTYNQLQKIITLEGKSA